MPNGPLPHHNVLHLCSGSLQKARGNGRQRHVADLRFHFEMLCCITVPVSRKVISVSPLAIHYLGAAGNDEMKLCFWTMMTLRVLCFHLLGNDLNSAIFILWESVERCDWWSHCFTLVMAGDKQFINRS